MLPKPELILEAIPEKRVPGEDDGGGGVGGGSDAVTGGREAAPAGAGKESGMGHFNTIDKPVAPRTVTVMPSITGWGLVKGRPSTSVGLTLPTTGEMIQPAPEGVSLNCSLLKNLESV
jgi:hypothetical protein